MTRGRSCRWRCCGRTSAAFFSLLRGAGNCDGAILTIPHKEAAFALVDAVSDRAAALEAVNVVRREPDGRLSATWSTAWGSGPRRMRRDFPRRARRWCSAGAGAAGTAIAHAFAERGGRAIAVVESEPGRIERLAGKLAGQRLPRGGAELTGLAGGRRRGQRDAGRHGVQPGVAVLAGQLALLPANGLVGDAITDPAETDLLRAARARGSCDGRRPCHGRRAIFRHVRGPVSGRGGTDTDGVSRPGPKRGSSFRGRLMRIDGGCHCGEIAYSAEIDPEAVSICHCTDCQTLSGSPYRVSVVADREHVTVSSGEPAVYVKMAESGRKRFQYFCRNCGSPLFTTGEGERASPLGHSLGQHPPARRPAAPQADLVPLRRALECGHHGSAGSILRADGAHGSPRAPGRDVLLRLKLIDAAGRRWSLDIPKPLCLRPKTTFYIRFDDGQRSYRRTLGEADRFRQAMSCASVRSLGHRLTGIA